jgi:tetratricopeptide (TPR) repeat protein
MPRTAGQHVDNPAAVGTRVRLARERAGLSQRELSFEGCTYAYISRIESGQRTPSLQLLQEFGQRLGVSARYLATGADSPYGVDLLDEADLARRLGDRTRAQQLYRQISEDTTNAPLRRAQANVGLGELYFQQGDYETAEVFFELARASGAIDAAGAATSSDRLGRIYALRGEFEKSIAIYEQTLTQAETLGDEAEVMRFATLLANAVLDAGNLGRAQELLGRALSIGEGIESPLDRARLWWTQSRLHDSQGQPDLAARYARLALAVLEEQEQVAAAGVAHLLLAYIENERGNADAALESLERAEPIISSGTDRFHQALLQIERARAALLKGERENAAALAMGALPHVLQASAIDSGRAQALLGDVFRELDDRERAQELYELAVETLPSVDSNLIRVYGGLAALLEDAGRELEALDLLKQAMRLRQTQRALT